MIQKTEIRIGNWFKHTKNWSYRQDGYNLKEFNFKWNETDWYSAGDCMIFLEDIEPIPLTEEILLKCGFEKNVSNTYVKNGIVIYNIWDIGICYSINIRNWIKTPYVHSLQNLYFALTGQELEINL